MRINWNNGIMETKSLQGLKTRTRTRPQGPGYGQGPDPQGPGQRQGPDPQGPGQGQGPDPQEQDKDKDLKNVLKESLRTRTRINIPGILSVMHVSPSDFLITLFLF